MAEEIADTNDVRQERLLKLMTSNVWVLEHVT